MPTLLIILLIAVSISMDAFSLSLAYGTVKLSKKDTITLSVIVGLFHFLMPLIGMYVGKKIIYLLPIETNFLVFLVLLIIGIEMIIETFRQSETVKYLNIIEMLLFGFAVSIDSFSIGLGLQVIYKYPILPAIIFAITSMLFSYMGLTIGKYISKTVGEVATFLGGITLIIVSFLFLV